MGRVLRFEEDTALNNFPGDVYHVTASMDGLIVEEGITSALVSCPDGFIQSLTRQSQSIERIDIPRAP